MTPLEQALSAARTHDPGTLSFCHVALRKHLAKIVRARQLTPTRCDVFGTDLIYFSYGAAYYRPPNHQTQNLSDLPVAFVFRGTLLRMLNEFYPFDTGGVSCGKFGAPWAGKFTPLEDYSSRNHDAPRRIVSCLYGTNSDYLRGRVVGRPATRTAPIPLLHRFLKEDLSELGADQRQRTIECLSSRAFPLVDHLDLVMLPDIAVRVVKPLWVASAEKFEFISYATDESENPASALTHVNKTLRDRYRYQVEPPG